MAYLIMLDAGHGGQDPGAVYKGRQEKNDNLKLALAVGEILKNKGIDISYTRTGDVYQTPFEKAQLANQAGVDYFISFHRNSSPKENQYNGAEVLIYDKSGIKYQMAENILGALGEVGFREIGVKERPGLVVLRRTRMPALLIEIGFINSEEDNKLFDNKFSDIAQGIADAILGWIHKIFRGKKGGQLGMGLLVGTMDIATANNTVAIVMANPIAKEMAEEYGITPRKTASLLDTFSCVFQGVIPYGAQMLVAISAVNELGGEISAFQIMPKLFYPMLLLLSSLITIMRGSDRTGA